MPKKEIFGERSNSLLAVLFSLEKLIPESGHSFIQKQKDFPIILKVYRGLKIGIQLQLTL